jgi:hypothetical protein
MNVMSEVMVRDSSGGRMTMLRLISKLKGVF